MGEPVKPITARKCIMIIAGEASGDLHGAKLVEAMRAQDPSLFFCGVGGQALQAAGVRILVAGIIAFGGGHHRSVLKNGFSFKGCLPGQKTAQESKTRPADHHRFP